MKSNLSYSGIGRTLLGLLCLACNALSAYGKGETFECRLAETAHKYGTVFEEPEPTLLEIDETIRQARIRWGAGCVTVPDREKECFAGKYERIGPFRRDSALLEDMGEVVFDAQIIRIKSFRSGNMTFNRFSRDFVVPIPGGQKYYACRLAKKSV